jgi:hypothetical protein
MDGLPVDEATCGAEIDARIGDIVQGGGTRAVGGSKTLSTFKTAARTETY